MRCQRIGCTSEATHALKLVIPDATTDATSAEGLLGVELCALHITEAQAKPFVGGNPAIEALMRAVAEPGTEPDFTEAYIEPVAVGGVEYLAWQRQKARPPN